MAAEIADIGWGDASFTGRLADAAGAVADLAGAAGRLGEVAETDLAAVMSQLTTLVAQLDGLRVAVTRRVRDAGTCRLQGSASVTGWLRADPRTADSAPALAALAAHAAELPQVTALLTEGSASLAQAGAACWQIAHLPDTVEPPGEADEIAALTDPQPEDELWTGLWRAGNVRAAADQLFAGFLPRLDAAQLRVLGAHLREAADAQERAGADYNAYAARAVRLSRTLDGTGALSGRLHPEAAEQVIAAFEELGAKTGPDDTRTKAQRQADALVYLTSLAGLTPAEPGDGEPADDQPGPDGGHGHDSLAPSDATGPDGRPPAGSGRVPAGLRRPRVIVTIPLSSLLGQPLAPGGMLGAGTPITAEGARRLACDAEIIRLITGPPGAATPAAGLGATGQLTALLADAIAGLPGPLGGPSAALDIGRKSQGWTARQRDALHALYGGRCGAPGCTRPFEVIHHIIHWLHGGKTKTSNGAPFCHYHHWLVHEGGWRVTRQRDGTLMLIPPPPTWRPGAIYRRGKPVPDTTTAGPPVARGPGVRGRAGELAFQVGERVALVARLAAADNP